MAQLPAYLFQEQLPRSPGAATGIPTVGRQSLGGAGGGSGMQAVSTGLSDLANTIARVDQRFQDARNKVDEAEGFGTGLDILATSRNEVLNERTLNPLDRGKRFEELARPAMDAHVQGLPEQVRGSVMLRLTSMYHAEQRQLHDQGREDFEKQSRAGLTTVLEQLQRQEMALTNPVDIARLQHSRSAIIQSYTDAGLLTAAEGANALTAATEAAGLVQLEQLMVTRPDLVIEHMEQLAQGEAGIPGLYVPPADKRKELSDKAEAEWDETLIRKERQEASTVREKQRQSAGVRVTFVERMVAAANQPAVIQALMNEAKTVRQQGGLVSEDAEFLALRGSQMLEDSEGEAIAAAHHAEARAIQMRNETHPAVLQEYLRLLMTTEDPNAAINFAMARTGRGLAVGSVPGLVQTAKSAREDRHWRNLPETKGAIAFVQGALSTTGDPMLDAVISVDMSAIQQEAINELLVRAGPIAGADGLNKPAYLEALPAIRDEVVQSHRARIKQALEKQPQSPGAPQTRSVKDAVRQWQFMLQQGSPKHEADAFLGRELARHSALVSPADQAANAAAVAAELEQIMRDLQGVRSGNPANE